jgi:hypothetical protein|tara:strand:+ start:165 stop:458 length:294 start_codon:yes stop_codon:yes gene_type:complete
MEISVKPYEQWSERAQEGFHCNICGKEMKDFHKGQYIHIVGEKTSQSNSVTLAPIAKDAMWSCEYDSVGSECAKRIPRNYRMTKAQAAANDVWDGVN